MPEISISVRFSHEEPGHVYAHVVGKNSDGLMAHVLEHVHSQVGWLGGQAWPVMVWPVIVEAYRRAPVDARARSREQKRRGGAR